MGWLRARFRRRLRPAAEHQKALCADAVGQSMRATAGNREQRLTWPIGVSIIGSKPATLSRAQRTRPGPLGDQLTSAGRYEPGVGHELIRSAVHAANGEQIEADIGDCSYGRRC